MTYKMVQDIKAGDRLAQPQGWAAVGDAVTDVGLTFLRVRYADGGIGHRQWDDPMHVIPVDPAPVPTDTGKWHGPVTEVNDISNEAYETGRPYMSVYSDRRANR
jgi:hypothetical protein